MTFDWRGFGLACLIWAALGMVLLSVCACAGAPQRPEPKLAVQIVKVAVAVPCAAALPPEPAYADSAEALKAASDIFRRVQLLLAGRIERGAYIAELRASRAGCDP